MNINELKEVIKKNLFTVDAKYKSNISKDENYLFELMKKYVKQFSSNQELTYLFLNNMNEPPKCYCGKYLCFHNYKKPYTTFCSKKCSLSSDFVKQKRKNTNEKKFGVSNPFQDSDIKNKIKNTNITKYGSIGGGRWAQEGKEKARNTNIEKYGYDNPAKSCEVKEKIKETCLEKYGVDHPWKNKNIRDKCKVTSIEKYGVDNPSKSEIVKDITKNTNEIRYGGHSSKDKAVRLKFQKNKYYKALSRYSNFVTPLFSLNDFIDRTNLYSTLLWKCNTCTTEFPYPIANGIIPRCPHCYPSKAYGSSLEKELISFVKYECGQEIVEHDRNILEGKELDLYIPNKNIAIEFDGIYWHSELNGKDKKYHLDKTKTCLQYNIKLYHILSSEWINKKDIVKSIIKSKLGIYDKKVGARECSVKEISSSIANTFYDANHIQGGIKSSINFGLFFENELVSCLSFSKPRFNKKYDWEITRFANKINYKVIGGFGKLWKLKPYGSIITYSDKRLFDGIVYKKYMNQLEDSSPGYWYFKNNICLYHRQLFQKKKLSKILKIYNETLSEWENMQLNGWDRIWDCGNFVFEFIP